MKKLTVMWSLCLLLTTFVFASGAHEEKLMPEEKSTVRVVASTSWTAAFADLAGLDAIDVIAPANLTHPPEYELTVSDIRKIDGCNLFLYAGYERMMETLGTASGNERMLKIHTDNSISTVASQVAAIAKFMHTEAVSKPRVDSYVRTVEIGKNTVHEKGLDRKRVLVHAMQVYLARDLGLEIDGTFGSGPVTAGQIADARSGNYDMIIDNVHNPVAGPLTEVAPEAKLVVWRNFPESNGRKSLELMVRKNIRVLLEQE